MVSEPRMIWTGNLIHRHTTAKPLSHQLIFQQHPQIIQVPQNFQAEITFPNEVKSKTCFWQGKKCPWVAHQFSLHLTKPFLHIVWEICPRSKVSQSWKRSIKLIFHDNLGEGLLWYICTALCVAEPWPILIPDILWSKRQVAGHKMLFGLLEFSSLVT